MFHVPCFMIIWQEIHKQNVENVEEQWKDSFLRVSVAFLLNVK